MECDKWDSSFQPSDWESPLKSDCSESTPIKQSYHSKLLSENKYLVFDSALKELFSMMVCSVCKKNFFDSKIEPYGAQILVTLICPNSHEYVWRSSPNINHMPSVNAMLSAAIVFSGNTYANFKNLANSMNIQCMSEQTFYKVQKNLIIPTILDAWQEESQRVHFIIKHSKRLVLAGDGRCDSPGFSAKYGAYTLLDTATGLIVDFSLVQSTDTTSSQAMEKLAFEKTLQRLLDQGIDIETIVTDRHLSISKLLTEKFSKIKHQFDIWHFSKSLVKKLTAAAKKKDCGALFSWIRSIRNHFWWCCATCGGDVQLLKEKYFSILSHVTNKHKNFTSKVYSKCAHPRLTKRQRQETIWIQKNSPAHKALTDVIFDKNLLKDMHGLTDYCHTGQLEVFHNLLLKYAPKRQHFSFDGMYARHALAVLDHNYNVKRKYAVTKSGDQRCNIVYSKRQKNWVFKLIKEKKSFSYLHNMFETVLDKQFYNIPRPSTLGQSKPKNIAPIPKPSKDVIKQLHQSRF